MHEHCTRNCGRDAEAAGELALAEAWFADNCQRGYRWSCDDLVRVRAKLAPGPPAEPSATKCRGARRGRFNFAIDKLTLGSYIMQRGLR